MARNRKIGSPRARHSPPTPPASLSSRQRAVVALCSEILFRYRHHADERLLDAVSALARRVRGNAIALVDAATNPIVFGRQSLLPALIAAVEPAMDILLADAVGGPVRDVLTERQVYPLSRYLGRPADCARLADAWHAVAELSAWDVPAELLSDSIVRQRLAASLDLLAEILHGIAQQLPQDDLRWCAICFRRAPYDSAYCRVHRPVTNTVRRKDTDYRKGRQLHDRYPTTEKDSAKQYRAARRAMGDAFVVVSDPSRLGSSDSAHGRFYLVAPEIESLVVSTQSRPWTEIRDLWSGLLSSAAPSVLARPARDPADCGEWDEFVTELMRALGDPYETTRHPYWIMQILVNAEEWFAHEARQGDGRRTTNAEKIRALHGEGMTNNGIAQQLGISTSYVSRILREG